MKCNADNGSRVLLKNYVVFLSVTLKYFSLFRYKNFFIQTQFDSNKRKWSDSSLFTTWFRLLSIAKIEVYLNLETNNKWQFINFPGIGYDKKI